MGTEKKTMGWGITNSQGAEIWDAEPVFRGPRVTLRDRFLLLFYPKKWFLYRYIQKSTTVQQPGKTFRILDVGCGTGATVIDLKKFLGDRSEVIGLDVVQLQVDLAREKLKKYGVSAQVERYDGLHIPLPSASVDALHTSDVLGHVENVSAWLAELSRVLKPGGALAMFSESQLGQQAYIRNYLLRHGLNIDPHANYHISLYSKLKLKELVETAGFEVKKMYSSFWAAFLVHPDEFYPSLQNQQRFSWLRQINRTLYILKKKTQPYSTALGEFYGLVEMLLVGKWVEAQGYVVLAKKK